MIKTIVETENLAALVFNGAIDAGSAPTITAAFSEQVQKGRVNLIFDMSQVSFMSSAGLRIILGNIKETRALGGDFRIVAPPPKVVKILKLAGFLNVVKSCATIDEAVASYGEAK